MTRIRTRAVGLLAALALTVAAPAAGGLASASPPIAAAKSCSGGYTHAVIGGQQKCLRRGQFCTHGKAGQYTKYGFHCNKRDKNGRYHLT
ncbi:MAG: hypothetical protein QOE06_236 [Thermoleophilaceae bacterium]|jgi:hypothetical protein|nr:hypothetical protein [Thermoleophilaceae bacterium]